MGLLDDAIREHLDLKRRRGADPTEVERAEREALGPVRRGPEPEPADEAADGVPAYDLAAEQDWKAPPAEEFPSSDAPPQFDRTYEPPPSFERPAPTLADEPPLADDHAMTDEHATTDEPPRTGEPPPPGSPEAPRSPNPRELPDDDHPGTPLPHQAPAAPGAAGGETVEYRIDEALEGEPKPKNEDVLEETPEFLQDTPDHDRLWFEQRPPKDFDFEG